MFLNFMKNVRGLGHSLLVNSWILGLIVAFGMIFLTPGDLISPFLVGMFVFLKFAFIGFVIQIIADMFLVEKD